MKARFNVQVFGKEAEQGRESFKERACSSGERELNQGRVQGEFRVRVWVK